VQLTLLCQNSYFVELSNIGSVAVNTSSESPAGKSSYQDAAGESNMSRHWAKTQAGQWRPTSVTVEDAPMDEDEPVKWNTPAE
jgi:hypothetical protein